MKTTSTYKKIERIICPFDFSVTASAGLDYAGMLAKALDATLTIFYVQPSVWPEALQLYEDQNDIAKGVRRLMKIEAQALVNAGVSCEYIIESTTDTIEMAVGAISADFDLIVMGTNGADTLYQHVFGTNTYHILGLARCPVLMIPEGYEARVPRSVVYAFDPETNPVFLVEQLQSLVEPLEADVTTINVIPATDGSEALVKIEQLDAALGVMERKGIDWDFEPSYADDVVGEIDQSMKEGRADILALSYHHRNVFDRLFSKNVLKEVTRIAAYPVLVFWH